MTSKPTEQIIQQLTISNTQNMRRMIMLLVRDILEKDLQVVTEEKYDKSIVTLQLNPIIIDNAEYPTITILKLELPKNTKTFDTDTLDLIDTL